MHRVTVSIVWAILFMGISPLRLPQDGPDHLSGIVRSDTGDTISGVTIYAWHDTTTDADGKFQLPGLPDKDLVIFFQKEGYRPKSIVVKVGTTVLNVVLEDDKNTAWTLPTCSSADAGASPIGGEIQYRLPKDAKVRKIKDIDYVEYLVSFAKYRKPLQLWYGGLVSPGQMLTKNLLRSASFEERSIHIQSGQRIVSDRRGKNPDGTVWRIADFPGSASAIYESTSTEEAARYDPIIDSACQLNQGH
jgi:hypothetical protein